MTKMKNDSRAKRRSCGLQRREGKAAIEIRAQAAVIASRTGVLAPATIHNMASSQTLHDRPSHQLPVQIVVCSICTCLIIELKPHAGCFRLGKLDGMDMGVSQ